MKRALAERAKQTLPIPEDAPSGPEGVHPPKIPRLEKPKTPPVRIDDSQAAVESASRDKRIQSLTDAVSSDEHDSASAFYLRHQNRALATELKSLQFSVTKLEEERNGRRKQCLEACKALNSLHATWTNLESTFGIPPGPTSTPDITNTGPPSTGSGDGVEWTQALALSLARLGNVRPPDGIALDDFFGDLSQLSANVSKRASVLQECIVKVMKNGHHEVNGTAAGSQHDAQLSEAVSQCRLLEQQISELATSRSEALARERKLRRNLYRMLHGMLSSEQVMKSLDGDDADVEIKAQVQAEADATRIKEEESKPSNTETSGEPAVSSAQAEQLEARIKDLTETVSARDETLKELGERLQGKEIEINNLTRRQQTDEDAARLCTLVSTEKELEGKRTVVEELKRKDQETREKWKRCLGNEMETRRQLQDQASRFQKRWAEFTTLFDGECGDEEAVSKKLTVSQAEKIAELTHKLNQAMEVVRQSETKQASLNDALELHKSLQATIDELKSARVETDDPINGVNVSTDEASGDEKYDRLLKEYRKIKADLAEATENSQKESEELQRANMRLMRQSREKDEMNARSLSTILQLKEVAERLTEEKSALEEKAKSADQLAVAARLAANARDRFTQEAEIMKKGLEEELSRLKDEHESCRQDLSALQAEKSAESGKFATLNSEISNCQKRNDDLVAQNDVKESQIRSLEDSLRQSKREASEASEKLDGIMQGTHGNNSSATFSVSQLNTQISVLKSRLACPVCHHRDKECIIMRCRHMHCKQCVDERVQTRSRKCPTCNNKFSEKDVEDIWLS